MTTDDVEGLRDTVDRRFPEALAKELTRAMDLAERVIPDPDERWEMLSRFRRNRTRYIAAWGLEPDDRPVDGLEAIPIEYHGALHDLDRAYAKLQDYRVHPEHYVSATVAGVIESALQSRRASKPRQREGSVSHEEIARYLVRQGIRDAAHGRRKGIVADAAQHFDVSESKINRAIRACKLGKHPAK